MIQPFSIFRKVCAPASKLSLRILAFSMIPTIALSADAAPFPQSSPAAKPADAPVEVTLRPASAPVPALKYRLVPERRKLIHGNAAIFYHRAIQMVILDRGQRMATALSDPAQNRKAPDDEISRWTNTPLGDLPHKEIRELLINRFGNVLNELEQGTLRDTCDWEFDQRTDGIWLLLSDLDESRTLARIVALRAQVAILDGKPDEAMHWIRTGMTLGRHVAQGPLLIQALIGVAIESRMKECLLEMIQSPGTPSLYWALADRPRPLIDPRPAYEGERYTLERELPGMSDIEDHVWSDDEARRFADTLQRKLYTFMGGQGPTAPGTEETLSSFERRFRIAAIAARLYPEASRAVIAEGWPEAKIKAMPVLQVACLYTYSEYRKLRDETYKWLHVPYRHSFDKLANSLDAIIAGRPENPLLTFFGETAPSLKSARLSFARLEREFDAVQAIEAIRLYSHSHQGALPPSLEAMTEAPVPIDLATGKPFEYKVSGDTATLSGPVLPGAPDHPRFKVHYLLKLTR